MCLIKNKREVGLFQILQKERFLHPLSQPSAFVGNLTMFPLSCAFQERSSSLLQFNQEQNIPGHPFTNRAYWFILKIARIFPILTSRNMTMKTFILVNINPVCKRLHRISLSFSIPKRSSFSLQFFQEQNLLWHSFEKGFVLFWKLPGYLSLFTSKAELDRNVNTLVMVNINPIRRR